MNVSATSTTTTTTTTTTTITAAAASTTTTTTTTTIIIDHYMLIKIGSWTIALHFLCLLLLPLCPLMFQYVYPLCRCLIENSTHALFRPQMN